jgi:RNA polymerase sigma factor (TIGR02999 family)
MRGNAGADQPRLLQDVGKHDRLASKPKCGVVYWTVMNEITRVLSQVAAGNELAGEQLLPLVYEELRKLAAQRLAQERPGQTLQATALVHEAYIRLVDSDNQQRWDSRGHFFAAAARAMRRILIESARRKQSQKHGGGWRRVGEIDQICGPSASPDRLVALDEALDLLADDDPQSAQLMEQCLFAGVSVEDAGQALGWSRATAYRHWAYARAFLIAQLSDL